MSKLDSNLGCPSCQASLQPKILECEGCGIKVEGPFRLNEFATLPAEDLHFLRIFVQSEGRIREMESALGLSYPTIRNRLAALKSKLAGDTESAEKMGTPPADATQQILERLQAGVLTFAEAMQQIKKQRSSR